ncbi:MAG: sugar phosphate isomerase/epimerase [Candidatus Hydrogenedentes bacterium]|nr:sugar phosphate isomerase/epimerase [Candidatus Hydrogenedentota bacterium]
MSAPGIALQLYTLREAADEDLLGTLRSVRDIGFEFVQWSGMPVLLADEIRELLDTAGLRAVAGHCSVESFEKDFQAAFQHWKTIGVEDLAPGSMMLECRDSLVGWRQGARRLDALGARLRESGIRFSYHNHAFEFERFPDDPRYKLDILYEETHPENLYAEFDTAWIYWGKTDPAACLRKYAARCPVIHVKDVAADSVDGKPAFKPLGQGALGWPEIFRAGREAGVEWWIYEQDSGDGDPFDNAQISFEFLKKNLCQQ